MKKIFIMLLSAMLLLTACNSSPSEKHDFGNVDFGMSEIELFKIEGEPDTKTTSSYVYYGKEIFGLSDAFMAYTLDENGICAIFVNYEHDYIDNKSYITEYNIVKENLISEWGEPQTVTEDNENFIYKCEWDNDNNICKSVKLFKDDDNKVVFGVGGFTY